MSQPFYTILAASASTGQTQREFDQAALEGNYTTNKQLAEQKAAAFAHRLNQQQKLRATDWVGRVELTVSSFVKK